MENTTKNLKTAFAGESQANRKYLAYAQKAEEEGRPNLARLFRAVTEGETVHALKHFNRAGKVKNSKSNLEDAIAGETYETEKMYPEFIREAEEENQAEAKLGFEWAYKVELVHKGMFSEALEVIENGDIASKEYYVCLGCGYPAEGEAPEKCPVCGGPKSIFRLVS